jgi:phosphoribosylglycinamide formyltransferase-1
MPIVRPSERFVSEPIRPVKESFDAGWMAQGVPGLPRAFDWRGERFVVAEVVRAWRSTRPCTHGSGERYAGRHWFEIRTEPARTMTLYFDKAAPGRRKRMGWFLFAVRTDPVERIECLAHPAGDSAREMHDANRQCE